MALALVGPDGGPIYTETKLDQLIAEPFNGLSALLFLLIALYWIMRVGDNRRNHQFIFYSSCLLAVGGLGGALYHGFRVSKIFFLMDVVPIGILVLAVGVVFWKKALGSTAKVTFYSIAFVALNQIPFLILPRQVSVSTSYFIMACFVAGPLLYNLKLSGFQHGKIVLGSMGLFAVALVFRVCDSFIGNWLTIGTHWLWHVFSAGSVFLLIQYIFLTDLPQSGRTEPFLSKS